MTPSAAALCRRTIHLIFATGLLVSGAPAVRGQVDQATAEKMTAGFDRGMAAFQKREWAAAVTEMEKVISVCEGLSDPKAKETARQKLAPVYYTVGAAAYNVPDYSKAIAAFERFIQAFPNHEKVPMARLAVARSAYMNKDYDKAAEVFGMLEQYPSLREQALLIQAQCFKERGKKPEMLAVVEKFVAGGIKSSSHAGAAMLLVQAWAEAGEWEKAEPLLDQLVAQRDLVENLAALNELIVSLGDAQAGKEEYEKATRTYAKVMPLAEVISQQKGRIAALEARLAANEKAAARDPQGSAAVLAQNAEVQTELEQARTLLVEFQKVPDFTPALLLRNARCWYGRGGKWESILVYERLLERYPGAKEKEAALFGCLISYADVQQVKICRQLCAQYLTEFPKGEHAGTVAYLQGSVVLESGDARGAVTLLGAMIEKPGDNEYIDQIYLMLGGAHASLGEMDQALEVYQKYIAKFPKGTFIEEAKYRAAIIPLFEGRYGEGQKALESFLKEFPRSSYVQDAKYRLMVCKYAAKAYDEVLKDVEQFAKEHPGSGIEAEVLSMKGDCLVAQFKHAEAVAAYQGAVKKASTDEVLDYALNGASKALQKVADWPGLSKMWEEFIRENPEHPNVVAGIYWITRAKTKEGRLDEAKQIAVNQLKLCLNDRKNESVEMLLQQLAQICWKRPRSPAAPGAAPAGERKETLPPWDAVGELEKLVAPLDAMADATGAPRLDYARAELLKLLKKPEEMDVVMRKIAAAKPEVLSPQLLAMTGEYLQGRNLTAQAEACYNHLKDGFAKTAWMDWAYCGLGGIALAKGDAKQALELYALAMDEYTGSKVKDSMMGRGMALLELGRGAEAKPLFEQVAGTREWRGEITAQAVYYLGQVEERENRLPEAVAFYQRVFVAYQKYIPWVEKAYIRAAQCFEKLGKRPEAVAHLQELLRNEKLGFEAKNEARKMLKQWGAAE